MELTSKMPLYIFIYAFLITLLPALMVGFSFFSPQEFFLAYGIAGERHFNLRRRFATWSP